MSISKKHSLLCKLSTTTRWIYMLSTKELPLSKGILLSYQQLKNSNSSRQLIQQTVFYLSTTFSCQLRLAFYLRTASSGRLHFVVDNFCSSVETLRWTVSQQRQIAITSIAKRSHAYWKGIRGSCIPTCLGERGARA